MANEKYWKTCNEKVVCVCAFVCVRVVGLVSRLVSHCVALCYYVLDRWKLWALKQVVKLQTLVHGHKVRK
jgi:hypothetical protein